MNKVRRALLISIPVGAALGLSGCSLSFSGNDGETTVTMDPGPEAGVKAFAEGQALKITPASGASIDAAFKPDTAYQYLVPDTALKNACINDGNVFVTLCEGIGDHARALSLVLPAASLPTQVAPADGAEVAAVISVASLTSGSASVVVSVDQFDAATGVTTSTHYDYLLSGGTITVTGLQAFEEVLSGDLTLVFAGVIGTPTSTAQVSNNVAATPIRLDGTVKISCREEFVSWLI